MKVEETQVKAAGTYRNWEGWEVGFSLELQEGRSVALLLT